MFVKAPADLQDYFVKIIEEELNVKKVSFTDDVSSYTDYTFKPQLRTVGPKYGKYLKQIQQALAQLNGNAAMSTLRETGVLKLEGIHESIALTEEDLLITTTQMEGYMTETDQAVTVVLDTNLTPELLEEGFVREIISKLQTMRKEAGFEVMDKIAVSYTAAEKASDIFTRNQDTIRSEVLAVSLVPEKLSGYTKEWNINGEKVTLSVEKQS
jgi:isoleucyl-tRNA synthetase